MIRPAKNGISMAIRREHIGHSVKSEEEFNLDEIGDLRMDRNLLAGLKRLFDHLSSDFANLHQEAVVAIERHDAIDADILAGMKKIDAQMRGRKVGASALKMK